MKMEKRLIKHTRPMFNISPSGGLTGTQNTSSHILSKRETVEITMNVYSHYGEQCGDSLKNWK